MITIHFWLFMILCMFALGGLVGFIFLTYVLVIDPIKDIVKKYKIYKRFYIEYCDNKFIAAKRRKKEVEEDE